MSNIVIGVEYVLASGERRSLTTCPGSAAHLQALEHERQGQCVVIVEIDMDFDDGVPY